MKVKKILIIANPTAGSGKTKNNISKIEEFFKKKNITADIYLTRKPKDATLFLKKSKNDYDCIIAAGGDGTINEVINGLAKTNIPIGIIPLGTENVLASALNIPYEPIKACQFILDKKPKLIDLGIAKKRYFILMVGVGFDAYVASKVEPFFKKILGAGAYALKAIESLFKYDAKELDIVIDGKIRTKGYFLLIANSRQYTSVLKFASKADMSDGKLDVCVFKNKDIFNMVKYILAAFAAKAHEFDDVEYYKAKDIKVTSKQKVLAHTDCELIGPTPIDIKIEPKAIRLIF